MGRNTTHARNWHRKRPTGSATDERTEDVKVFLRYADVPDSNGRLWALAWLPNLCGGHVTLEMADWVDYKAWSISPGL
jgi:hypothetical protein